MPYLTERIKMSLLWDNRTTLNAETAVTCLHARASSVQTHTPGKPATVPTCLTG